MALPLHASTVVSLDCIKHGPVPVDDHAPLWRYVPLPQLLLFPKGELIGSPSLGLAGAQAAPGLPQFAEALPGQFLGDDVREERRGGWSCSSFRVFVPSKKCAIGLDLCMKIPNLACLNVLGISSKNLGAGR